MYTNILSFLSYTVFAQSEINSFFSCIVPSHRNIRHACWNQTWNLPHHHPRGAKNDRKTNERDFSHLQLCVQVSIGGHHVLILLLARGFDEHLLGLPELLLHPGHHRAVLHAAQHVRCKPVGPQWVPCQVTKPSSGCCIFLGGGSTVECIHTHPLLDIPVWICK